RRHDDRVDVLARVLEDARYGGRRDVRVAAAEVEPPLERRAAVGSVAGREVDAVVLERPFLALLLRDPLRGDEEPVVVARAGDVALIGAVEQLAEIGAVEEGIDGAVVERERLTLVPP